MIFADTASGHLRELCYQSIALSPKKPNMLNDPDKVSESASIEVTHLRSTGSLAIRTGPK